MYTFMPQTMTAQLTTPKWTVFIQPNVPLCCILCYSLCYIQEKKVLQSADRVETDLNKQQKTSPYQWLHTFFKNFMTSHRVSWYFRKNNVLVKRRVHLCKSCSHNYYSSCDRKWNNTFRPIRIENSAALRYNGCYRLSQLRALEICGDKKHK